MEERKRLIGRLEQEREQLLRLRVVVDGLADRVAHDERMLHDIEEALGTDPQLRLDQSDLRLRGRRLEEVAIELLSERTQGTEPIHYTEWFEMLRIEGHLVAGKEPIDTFLAQINRSSAVERVGRRTGLYKLAGAA